MLSKIVKKSNLGLELAIQKAEQEVAKAEARVESLRLSKNRATERLHAARGHFQILKARLDARIEDLKADLTCQK